MAYRHTPDVYDPKFADNKRRRDLEDMLGEWYGKEFASSEITCRTDAPQQISAVLDKLMQERLDQKAWLLVELKNKWQTVVAPPMDKYVQLYTVRDHTAILEVSHPAFLIELRKKNTTEQWRSKLSAACPELEIQDVEFVPAGQVNRIDSPARIK